MRTSSFTLILFLTIFMAGCQQNKALNLDFEEINNGLPLNWKASHHQTGFSVSLDSLNVKSGKYSVAIQFTGDIVDYRAFTLKLPHNYDGERIALSGYIKTENVTDGFAGLWLMVDPDTVWRPYEISFMEQEGITGTNDWRKYEITLDMSPSENNEIEIGGLLSGKGKMWIDDLKITIDGNDIENAKLYHPKSFPAKEDNGSDINTNIIFPEMSKPKIDDLELLGKIWGFLKYHHTKIAKGNYNWDYELFRILPTYLNVANHEQRDCMLVDWINHYGRISKSKACKSIIDSSFLKPDLAWIENSDISLKLKDLLYNIYKNRNQGSQYYIKIRPYTCNPVFMNEEAYVGKEHLPDAKFRLLSLFRCWNVINYFYPYKYLTDKNWDLILREYVPYFIKSESRLEYELIVARLLGEVCDSHASLYEGWDKIESLKGFKQIPAAVQFVENRVVVTRTKNVDLKIGDIITGIDGKSVINIVDSLKQYYPASNNAVRMNNIMDDLLRSNKDNVQIEYISFNGKTNRKIIKTVNRKDLLNKIRKEEDRHSSYKFIDKDIGYIDLGTIVNKDILVAKKMFSNTKGLVIDLRSLPSDIFHMLAPYFVSNTKVFSKHTRGNPDNPGQFIYYSTYSIPKSKDFYKGKLIVIVNEETFSNAEYAAMAFQAGENTTIIGCQTGGTDGNISKIVLPGGLTTYISGNGIYYPDGKETQRIGIIPDIEVRPTIKGVKEGRDELLEKAIEFIRKQYN